VTLEKGKARLFQDGNPLIYGGAVKTVEGDPQAGDEVIVKDHNGNVFGRGFFNPFSQYRVRVMSRNGETEFKYPIADLIKVRINQAINLRKAMMLPSSASNVYRLVNGEGDRLSGLIVDVLGSTVVVQSSALWVELNANYIRESLKEFVEIENKKLIWRRSESRLNQDGFGNHTKSAQATDEMDEVLSEPIDSVDADSVEIVIENGVKFSVDPVSDQKTGFYCDQRENRQLIKGISKGKTVLDTYCYTGGFSLNAVLGGAKGVTAVDSSRSALAALTANMELNNIDPEKLGMLQGDAVEVMKKLVAEGQKYDVVICDPPKLAPTRASLSRAEKKYQQINTMALSLVAPGGLLLTCTCSAAMTQATTGGNRQLGAAGSGFHQMIQAAAKTARREVVLLSTSGAGSDHPVLIPYPEGRYLTAALLYVI
jgi:23S rRNA G2069 N7-methylase RlmK/C1962 C5-methylase RlmI